jgi:hypothetical protein
MNIFTFNCYFESKIFKQIKKDKNITFLYNFYEKECYCEIIITDNMVELFLKLTDYVFIDFINLCINNNFKFNEKQLKKIIKHKDFIKCDFLKLI